MVNRFDDLPILDNGNRDVSLRERALNASYIS